MVRSNGKLWALLALVALAACEERTGVEPTKEQDEEPAAQRDPPPPTTKEPRPDDGPTGCPPLCAPPPAVELERADAPNPIPAENARPGHPDWRDGQSAHNGEVELYLDTESASAGEQVGVKVSADAQAQVSAEIFRLGWYGGAGARRVWTGGPYEVGPQSECTRSTVTALIECDWSETFQVEVPGEWVSGLYVVKVSRSDGYKRFAPFVVRDARRAEILYTPNFTTWQAYNTWGGAGLYYDSLGLMPSGRSWQVSFNRPYAAAEGLGKTFELDLNLISFIERHGYDITYATQLDFLRYSNLLDGIAAMVHGAQDEYWSEAQRDQVDEALEAGGLSLAYFGGNGAYWRIRSVSDRQGHPLRTLSCFKSDAQSDPEPGSTVRFRDAPNPRPENNLFGNMYEGWQLVAFPLIVTNPSHWLFEGTGLQSGEQLQGLVGYEYDRAFPNLPGYPDGVQVSMESPVLSAEGIPSSASTVDRTLASGTLVFGAGTIWWPLGLSNEPATRDGRVQRMTLNVLERALQHRRPARQLPPASDLRPERSLPVAEWVDEVITFAGRLGGAARQDGPGVIARFRGPTGLAVLPTGEVMVADTGNNAIRMIAADPVRTVTTVAGNGELGFRDGAGEQAMFRVPTAVAVGPDGEVYVADSDNHVIRRLDRGEDGAWTVSTVAGKGFGAGFADGMGTNARFNRPTALAVDSDGDLFVADQANSRIRMIRAATGEVLTIAGNGEGGQQDSPTGINATFSNPSGIAVTADGTLYVMDAGNQRVRRIRPLPTWPVDTVAGDKSTWFADGYRDGSGAEARFRAQMGLAVDAAGALVLADAANYRLRRIIPGEDAASTKVETIAGDGFFGTARGTGEETNIVAPAGIAVGPDGDLYVSDSFHHVVLKARPVSASAEAAAP